MRTVGIALLLVFAGLTGAAHGQMFVWFLGQGMGDLMDSPPTFSGTMDAGGDIVAGNWAIVIDDSGWPLDPDARRTYIFDNFFAPNYEPGSPGYWTGYFDADHGLPSLPTLSIVDDTNAGTMSGVCSIQVTWRDSDCDQILDVEEGCRGALSGMAAIISGGTGVYQDMPGEGHYTGIYVRECPDTFEVWSFAMYLWLDGTRLLAEDTSWSAIKSMYR